jgi:hypothetical protein
VITGQETKESLWPDGRFVYFPAGDHPGTVVELSEISGRKGQFFKQIAEAARKGDGSEAIRRK